MKEVIDITDIVILLTLVLFNVNNNINTSY